MRLTHLKLAGFKSFVDPTTLHIHGQRVGVVGPNGCGKSNVMESIRWVLGESSAKEMRGDSMQDVIFNGSAHRKPVSRASVELMFDNSLGGAAGAWSQYAEIAVKRVLERDRGSTYYVNSTQVRRRDVADLFLGTGLGGRAYAIIGQNTISRIVEAKPDELRVTLEEAAGISKYKERRRETELRLRDTRDNLLRVEDIRQEMDKQILRLQSQAAVAAQYQRLNDALKLTHAQRWWLKKQEAGQAWEKSKSLVDKLTNALEAQMTALRHAESQLESTRLQQYSANEAVQVAQGRYYETNGELVKLEQQLKYIHENRFRTEQQHAQLLNDLKSATQSHQDSVSELSTLEERQSQVSNKRGLAEQDLNEAKQWLPALESAEKQAQFEQQAAQRALSLAEQQFQLERTHRQHAEQAVNTIKQTEQRLNKELANLVKPNLALLSELQVQIEKLESAKNDIAFKINEAIETELREQTAVQDALNALITSRDAQATLEAQINALTKLQQAVSQPQQLEEWLALCGLSSTQKLWQLFSVKSGWELAFEAVLGKRLNAMVVEPLNIEREFPRPPSSVTLIDRLSGGGAQKESYEFPRLIEYLDVVAPEIEKTLYDWLSNVYVILNQNDTETFRSKLLDGEVLVSQRGDIYTQSSIQYNAAQTGLDGVLERQRELNLLLEIQPARQSEVLILKKNHEEVEARLRDCRLSLQLLRQSEQTQVTNLHQKRMELQRLEQQYQHIQERDQSLNAEIQRILQQLEEANQRLVDKSNIAAQLETEIPALRQQQQAKSEARRLAENKVKNQRDQIVVKERLFQECEFEIKLISNNFNSLNNKIQVLLENLSALKEREAELASRLQSDDDVALKALITSALSNKQNAEEALANARNSLAEVEALLQNHDRTRLTFEQQLHPMRDKLEQSRLTEQQSRLHFIQCGEQLQSLGIHDELIVKASHQSLKLIDVEKKISDLELEIAELGAVNLAAIQELAIETERKLYLDSQSADLSQAIATLEEAIQRIDKETRARLQLTFDEANRHFAELFSTLFNGGYATLQLVGDEILDSGMQIIAQPPGKKNSSIHLLSGGEKALTALALVFALFRLNPAPFCLLDEVDAPLDDSNTERFCAMVRMMSERTQFLFVSHNKITMEMAQQMIGVTMQESGVSRIVEVDMETALEMQASLL